MQIKTYKNKVVASFGITVKPLKVKVIKSRFKVKDHMFQIKTNKNEVAASFEITVRPLKVIFFDQSNQIPL